MISNSELIEYLDAALLGLKDFQRASVVALQEGFQKRNRPSMLLADEVGLGKTIVAKGLIASLIKQRLEQGCDEPLKVTYICSNQVIARENLRKLNPFPRELGMKDPITRLAYLTYDFESQKQVQQRALELNTLTPSTSFDLSRSNGNKWERRAIYAALCSDLRMSKRRAGLQWTLRGDIRKMDEYRNDLEKSLAWPLRPGLGADFISLLKNTPLPQDASAVYKHLNTRRELTIYEALIRFSERIDGRNVYTLWKPRGQLVVQLRKALVECCLEFLNADIFILDEFQRFRDLIDDASMGEQATIAKRVFEQKNGSCILLVSATPFKAFTASDDLERGEDHFKDFKKILNFLLKSDPQECTRYEEHRQALYRQILDLRSGEADSVSSHHRDAVERVLRSVICRTERQNVAGADDTLMRDSWKEPENALQFGAGDIEHFKITDRLTRALEKVGYAATLPVEYCKSALFPLSFMDRYQFKEKLRDYQRDPVVSKALEGSGAGWIPHGEIDTYNFTLPCSGNLPANARLTSLVNHGVGEDGHRLLWIPPSLPYYPLTGGFERSGGFSKTLVFSSWIMVPRMISTLISYEVERRTVGDARTVQTQESEPRTYFTKDSSSRHPIPQLTFSMRTEGGRTTPSNMSNFTLLYPCQTLAAAVYPILNLREGRSFAEIKIKTAAVLRANIESANLRQFESPGGASDRWYWAAPLLLDRNDPEARRMAEEWMSTLLTERSKVFDSSSEKGKQDQARGSHLEFLLTCLQDPEQIALGRMPEDLPEILAELAIGSPATTALRSLRRLVPEAPIALRLKWAGEVAAGFESFFNKPESIAAVRLSEERDAYWQMVTRYCCSGCLQSVLDEYLHLLVEQHSTGDGAIAQLKESINLNAATINVDSLDSFKNGTSHKMRCHYAVEFGSQRMETEEGTKRASDVRQIFNSPFRPFVLATTSIGQEGLDFHSYCRRIVHWNLPGNPIDLEQREGRINRYKGLVIRQQVAGKYWQMLRSQPLDETGDVWRHLFQVADEQERIPMGKSELIPYWYVEPVGDARIERVIPMYPFSADWGRLQRILQTLAIYRLAFGQPRQAELVEHLLGRNFPPDELQKIQSNLVINLSPSLARQT